MKKQITENKITYILKGDYYFPKSDIPEDTYNIGKFGRMHGKFIKDNHPGIYTVKKMEGIWFSYLYDIDNEANKMYDDLISKMKERYGITEELKAYNQMKWVAMMTNIKHSAEEIIFNELIFKI